MLDIDISIHQMQLEMTFSLFIKSLIGDQDACQKAINNFIENYIYIHGCA